MEGQVCSSKAQVCQTMVDMSGLPWQVMPSNVFAIRLERRGQGFQHEYKRRPEKLYKTIR